jgi:hypothetical protein
MPHPKCGSLPGSSPKLASSLGAPCSTSASSLRRRRSAQSMAGKRRLPLTSSSGVSLRRGSGAPSGSASRTTSASPCFTLMPLPPASPRRRRHHAGLEAPQRGCLSGAAPLYASADHEHKKKTDCEVLVLCVPWFRIFVKYLSRCDSEEKKYIKWCCALCVWTEKSFV